MGRTRPTTDRNYGKSTVKRGAYVPPVGLAPPVANPSRISNVKKSAQENKDYLRSAYTGSKTLQDAQARREAASDGSISGRDKVAKYAPQKQGLVSRIQDVTGKKTFDGTTTPLTGQQNEDQLFTSRGTGQSRQQGDGTDLAEPNQFYSTEANQIGLAPKTGQGTTRTGESTEAGIGLSGKQDTTNAYASQTGVTNPSYSYTGAGTSNSSLTTKKTAPTDVGEAEFNDRIKVMEESGIKKIRDSIAEQQGSIQADFDSMIGSLQAQLNKQKDTLQLNADDEVQRRLARAAAAGQLPTDATGNHTRSSLDQIAKIESDVARELVRASNELDADFMDNKTNLDTNRRGSLRELEGKVTEAELGVLDNQRQRAIANEEAQRQSEYEYAAQQQSSSLSRQKSIDDFTDYKEKELFKAELKEAFAVTGIQSDDVMGRLKIIAAMKNPAEAKQAYDYLQFELNDAGINYDLNSISQAVLNKQQLFDLDNTYTQAQINDKNRTKGGAGGGETNSEDLKAYDKANNPERLAMWMETGLSMAEAQYNVENRVRFSSTPTRGDSVVTAADGTIVPTEPSGTFLKSLGSGLKTFGEKFGGNLIRAPGEIAGRIGSALDTVGGINRNPYANLSPAAKKTIQDYEAKQAERSEAWHNAENLIDQS